MRWAWSHVSVVIVAVQLLSRGWLFVTPWTTAHQASLSFTISRSLLKLMSIESVMPSNHLIICGPLLLLPSIIPSIRIFSNEYSGLISFRIDWFDHFAVQRTLKSLLQHHNLKASVTGHSALFMLQLSASISNAFNESHYIKHIMNHIFCTLK